MCSYSNFSQGILDMIIEYYKKNDEGKVIYSFMTKSNPKTYVYFSTEENAKIYVENYIEIYTENLYGKKSDVYFTENYAEGRILIYAIGDIFTSNRWKFMGYINIVKLGKEHVM